jgi:type IV fimbrial biogenesis protein FimT
MQRMAGRTRTRGFTLVEFIVTVSVLVIALGLTVPALGGFVARNEAASVKSSFVATLALARSEAARAGQQVILQASSGGPTGNEYANGWDLYLDLDGSATVTSGDTLLRHYEALPPALKLHGASRIVFSANGYLTPAAGLNFTLCRNDGNAVGWAMSVAPSGTTYTAASNACT